MKCKAHLEFWYYLVLPGLGKIFLEGWKKSFCLLHAQPSTFKNAFIFLIW
jgi:hypothetical protein